MYIYIYVQAMVSSTVSKLETKLSHIGEKFLLLVSFYPFCLIVDQQNTLNS